jgi:hypothetical protein
MVKGSARLREEWLVPGVWRARETRRQAEYERRKAATQKATAVKTESEEALRRRMEDPQAKPPEKLARKDLLLISEQYRRKRKLLSLVR